MLREDDPANGYETFASQYVERRSSGIGVETVRNWARSSLAAGAAVLDLGCGSGVPVSRALMNDGFMVHGVDASPSMVAMFRRQFPGARIACEKVEESRFFGRTFDGIVAWGLVFLLSAETQRRLVQKVAAVLNPGGSFLFTCPEQNCVWTDILTGRHSRSLGAEEYKVILSNAGLALAARSEDEAENHYFCVTKPVHADRPR